MMTKRMSLSDTKFPRGYSQNRYSIKVVVCVAQEVGERREFLRNVDLKRGVDLNHFDLIWGNFLSFLDP